MKWDKSLMGVLLDRHIVTPEWTGRRGEKLCQQELEKLGENAPLFPVAAFSERCEPTKLEGRRHARRQARPPREDGARDLDGAPAALGDERGPRR